MDTKREKPRWGGDGGVLNWAIGIHMYTLICIKMMNDKKKKLALLSPLTKKNAKTQSQLVQYG